MPKLLQHLAPLAESTGKMSSPFVDLLVLKELCDCTSTLLTNQVLEICQLLIGFEDNRVATVLLSLIIESVVIPNAHKDSLWGQFIPHTETINKMFTANKFIKY